MSLGLQVYPTLFHIGSLVCLRHCYPSRLADLDRRGKLEPISSRLSEATEKAFLFCMDPEVGMSQVADARTSDVEYTPWIPPCTILATRNSNTFVIRDGSAYENILDRSIIMLYELGWQSDSVNTHAKRGPQYYRMIP